MAEVVSFARDLYPVESVRAAIAAYHGLAHFELEVGEQQLVVRISEPRADVADAVADELANHALYEAIRAHGAGGALA